MSELETLIVEIHDIYCKISLSKDSVEKLLLESNELNPRLIQYGKLMLNIQLDQIDLTLNELDGPGFMLGLLAFGRVSA